MNVIYSSEDYYVVEFPGCPGIELASKITGRSGFLEGAVEEAFRIRMDKFVKADSSTDSVDEFLSGYDELLTHPLSLH